MRANRSEAATYCRLRRKLSDKIRDAFEHACNEGETEVATELLSTLETVVMHTPMDEQERQASVSPLIEAHQRLWRLKSGRLAP